MAELVGIYRQRNQIRFNSWFEVSKKEVIRLWFRAEVYGKYTIRASNQSRSRKREKQAVLTSSSKPQLKLAGLLELTQPCRTGSKVQFMSKKLPICKTQHIYPLSNLYTCLFGKSQASLAKQGYGNLVGRTGWLQDDVKLDMNFKVFNNRSDPVIREIERKTAKVRVGQGVRRTSGEAEVANSRALDAGNRELRVTTEALVRTCRQHNAQKTCFKILPVVLRSIWWLISELVFVSCATANVLKHDKKRRLPSFALGIILTVVLRPGG